MTSSNGNILPFVREIHWLRVDSPHKGQRHGALVIYLISAWTNGWVNNRDAGDFRRYRANYDFTVMLVLNEWGYTLCNTYHIYQRYVLILIKCSSNGVEKSFFFSTHVYNVVL